MKKMFDVTVTGFYVMSGVFGVLLATTLQLLYELSCIETLFGRPSFARCIIDLPWLFLGNFSGSKEDWWVHIVPARVTAALMMIALMIMLVFIVSGKNWRTKMIHAIMAALLLWLVVAIIAMAYYGYVSIGTLSLLAGLTVIPLFVLNRTRMPKKECQKAS